MSKKRNDVDRIEQRLGVVEEQLEAIGRFVATIKDDDCACALLSAEPVHEVPSVQIEETETNDLNLIVAIRWTWRIVCDPKIKGKRGTCTGEIDLSAASSGWLVTSLAGTQQPRVPLQEGFKSTRLEEASGECGKETKSEEKKLEYFAHFPMAKKPVVGKLEVNWTPRGCKTSKGWRMVIVLNSLFADGVNTDFSDWDGGKIPNKFDAHPWDPSQR